MIDLFDIWQSAQQSFEEFEKEMEGVYFGEHPTEEEYYDGYTSDFLDFWELYNKSRNKPGTYKKWQKLSDLDKKEIMLTLPAYIESTPDKKYRKDPQTYINQKSWKDEIIKTDQTTNKKGATPEQILRSIEKAHNEHFGL